MEGTETTGTTATSDSGSSSTPSAPASRPSMGAALEQAYAPTADATSTGTDTTAPSANAATDSPASTQPKGPIPFDVHHTALENARTKARAELETQYAWTKGLDPDQVKTAMGWRQRAEQDPTGFLQEFVAEGLRNPQIRPTILSLMGQNLAAARQPATPKPGELPKPRFKTTDDQGNEVPVYTAEDFQQIVTQLRQEMDAKVDEKLTPYEQERKAATQQRQMAQAAAKLTKWSGTTLADVRKLEGYTEHEPAIKAAFATMPETDGSMAAEETALLKAYYSVVIPHLKKAGADATLAQLKRDANATTLNPGSTGSPMPSKRPKDFKEALAWAEGQQQPR